MTWADTGALQKNVTEKKTVEKKAPPKNFFDKRVPAKVVEKQAMEVDSDDEVIAAKPKVRLSFSTQSRPVLIVECRRRLARRSSLSTRTTSSSSPRSQPPYVLLPFPLSQPLTQRSSRAEKAQDRHGHDRL